jgi:transitional endoplasmic reticulum ATPase
MNENTIESLREALRHSPNNTPLRLLLADTLLGLNRLEEAEAEYTLILKSSRRDTKATIGLAKVFYKKGNYSACNVILEEFIESGHQDIEALTWFAK